MITDVPRISDYRCVLTVVTTMGERESTEGLRHVVTGEKPYLIVRVGGAKIDHRKHSGRPTETWVMRGKFSWRGGMA